MGATPLNVSGFHGERERERERERVYIYDRTCFKWPLLGEWKTGHIRQVATYSRFQHED